MCRIWDVSTCACLSVCSSILKSSVLRGGTLTCVFSSLLRFNVAHSQQLSGLGSNGTRSQDSCACSQQSRTHGWLAGMRMPGTLRVALCLYAKSKFKRHLTRILFPSQNHAPGPTPFSTSSTSCRSHLAPNLPLTPSCTCPHSTPHTNPHRGQEEDLCSFHSQEVQVLISWDS